MKIENNVIILLSFLVVSSIIFPSYADSGTITAVSDKSAYEQGDKVTITGSVPQVIDENPVTLIIRNPIGNVYDVAQVDLSNNLFEHDFVISDDSIGGEYTVNVKYDAQTLQFHFTVTPSTLTVIPVLNNQITVRTIGPNLIKYGDVSVSSQENKITIAMNTFNVTTSTEEQKYQIPKEIVDTAGGDIALTVDGNNIQCTHSETDTMRILDCAIPIGSKELELSGTSVIPEFGQLASFAIATSMITAIVMSRTKKISF
jgi:hypothetical protein